MTEIDTQLLGLTAQIVAAYTAAETVAVTAVPGLIRDVHGVLASLERSSIAGSDRSNPTGPMATPRPAVEATRSVFAGHLVCLEDGLAMKTLKRHLRASHQLTPDQYRAKWDLPSNYPMVAPNYGSTRSRLAKEQGLGRKDPRDA